MIANVKSSFDGTFVDFSRLTGIYRRSHERICGVGKGRKGSRDIVNTT